MDLTAQRYDNAGFQFLIWYKTMFFMSVTKKGFSSKEIQINFVKLWDNGMPDIPLKEW